jgi:hypothetical protein
MIESLEYWVKKYSLFFKEKGINLSFSKGEVNNPKIFSVEAVFESRAIIGNIIVWNTGQCDVHLLKNSKKLETIFAKCYELKDETELNELLHTIINKMQI